LTAPGFTANLVRRVATAAVAIPAIVAALFLGPPALIVAIVAAALLVGLWEFYGLARARSLEPFRATGLLVAALLFVEVVYPEWLRGPVWPLGALLLLTVTLLQRRELTETVPAAAVTLLGSVYLGALGGAIAGLRTLAPMDDGAWRVVMLLGVIMGADTAAFFVGNAWGRRRLAPTVSPGKTVEGAFGGLLGGAVGAVAVRMLGLPEVPLRDAVLLGIVVAALGIVGDLDESLLKRWAGVKDSGRLFPGHGGMLDRLDSLLFGAPVLYYYFLHVRGAAP
jgi:phosphatidate cytidylyltransferase